MKKILVISNVALFVVLGIGVWVYIATERPQTFSQENLLEQTKRVQTPVPPVIQQEVQRGAAIVLDVRTDQERTIDGFIPFATHIDFAEFVYGTLPNVEYNTRIYVHCKEDTRAEAAKQELISKGFIDVINIGGLDDWITAGGSITYTAQ